MTVIVVGCDSMGRGSEDLGRQLMASFLRKVWANDPRPTAIVFYNSGVRLLARGSGVVDVLVGLGEAGVDLIACGTCVGYFELSNNLEVGRVSDMQEISTLLLRSDKVVTV